MPPAASLSLAACTCWHSGPPAPLARPARSTPLAAGIFSNVLHLGLLVSLVFGLGWGVAGAGLATSLSHWVAVGFLLANVLGRGYMRCAGLGGRALLGSGLAPASIVHAQPVLLGLA